MSASELVEYVARASYMGKEVADRTVYFTTHMVLVAVIAGITLKLWIGQSIGHVGFVTASATLLAIISFFTLIAVNPRHILLGLSLSHALDLAWILRIVIGLLGYAAAYPADWGLAFLLIAMPPALTAPALSTLWGGGQYDAIHKTVSISLIASLLIVVTAYLVDPGRVADVIVFCVFFVLALALPGALAQLWRQGQPIAAGKFAIHWRWLGSVALFAMTVLCLYHFTPADLLDVFTGPGFWQFVREGLTILIAFVFIRIVGVLSARQCNRRPISIDFYATHATPAVFLWMVFVAADSGSNFYGFWGCTFFFLFMRLDEIFLTFRASRIGEYRL